MWGDPAGKGPSTCVVDLIKGLPVAHAENLKVGICVRSFVPLFVCSSVCVCVRSCVCAFVRWFGRSFVRTFVRLLVCVCVRALVR